MAISKKALNLAQKAGMSVSARNELRKATSGSNGNKSGTFDNAQSSAMPVLELAEKIGQPKQTPVADVELPEIKPVGTLQNVNTEYSKSALSKLTPDEVTSFSPTFNKPSTQNNTFNFAPAVSDEIPTLSPHQNKLNNLGGQDLIDYYEALPKSGFLGRIFDDDKNKAYKEKQELYPRYQAEKDKQMENILADGSYGIGNTKLFNGTSNYGTGNQARKAVVDYLTSNGMSKTDANYLFDYYNRKQNEKSADEFVEYTDEHPFLGTVASVPLNAAASYVSAVNDVKDYTKGNPLKVDPTVKGVQDARAKVSEDMGVVGQTLYGAGTSLGDMGLSMLLGGGGKVSAAIMGLEKAADTINGAVERGLSPDQIIAEGIASGVTTAITEGKVFESVGESFTKGLATKEGEKLFKTITKSVVKNALMEGGQEVAEGALDIVADQIIANAMSDENKSELNMRYKEYLDADYSKDDAIKAVLKDTVKQGVMDFFGGAIAGGVMGGGASFLGGITNTNVNPTENVNEPALNQDLSTEEITNQNVNPTENVLSQIDLERLANELPMLDQQALAEALAQNVSEEQNLNPLEPNLAENGFNAPENAENGPVTTTDGINENGTDNNVLTEDEREAYLDLREQLLAEIDNQSDPNMKRGIAEAINQLDERYGYNNQAETWDNDTDVVMNEDTGLNPLSNYNITEMFEDNVNVPGEVDTDNEIDIPLNEALNLEGEVKTVPVSRTAENSFTNSATFRENERAAEWLENEKENGTFETTRISEKQSLESAAKRLDDNYDFEVKRLLDSSEINGVDIDESMMVADDYVQQVLENETEEGWNTVREWLTTMNNKIHGAAQGLQALAKYSRTATGLMAKTEKMISIKRKKANKKTNNIIDSVLRDMGYDGSMDNNVEKTYDQIREEVKNSLAKESSSIFSNFTDEDIDYLARQVEKGSSKEKIAERLAQKITTGYWDISNEDMKRVVELYKQVDALANPNSKQASDLRDEAASIMAKYLGEGTFMEKWNQWRYLSMLGNPRTHIRNILGNKMFGTLTNFKDDVAALGEIAVEKLGGKVDRTKSILTRKDNGLVDASSKDFDESVYAIATDGGDKYNMDTEINRKRKMFKDKGLGKAVNWANKTNSNFLETEDNNALRKKYGRALAGYLKANGKSASVINSKADADVEFMKKAREYAVEQAKIATFHEDSELANLLNAWSKTAAMNGTASGAALNFALESAMPFKKTPINILKQGAIEYNPAVQLPKAIVNTIRSAKNGSVDVSSVIDSYAKGMTGAMLLALGAFMSKKGWIRGGEKDDEDYALNEQAYSLNFGNHSYTIDWTAPASLPLFMGVSLYEAFTKALDNAEDDSVSDFGLFVDALTNIGAPVVEMSMLQGLSDTINSFSTTMSNDGTSGAALMSGLTSLMLGYLSQGVPTVGGQIARSVDPTRRSTYTGQKYGSVADTAMKNLIKIENKIPGLSYINEPYVNTFGEQEENTGGNVLGRLAYNMLSPGYYSNTARNEVTGELERLTHSEDNESTHINSLYPSMPNKSRNGSPIKRDVYTEISETQGKITVDNLIKLFDSDVYKNADDTAKSDMVSQVKSFSTALANNEVFGDEISKSYQKWNELYESGGMDAVTRLMNVKNIMDGSTSMSSIINAVDNAGLETVEDKGNYITLLKGEDNLSKDAKAVEEKLGAEGVYYWYSIAADNSTKEGKYNAIMQSDFPENVKQVLLDTVGYNGKSKSTSTKTTNTGAIGQLLSTVNGDTDIPNGSNLPKYDETKIVPKGQSYVNPQMAVDYLSNDLGLDPLARGEILYNSGQRSKKEEAAKAYNGYEGVSQYYDIKAYGDSDNDGIEKGEVIKYLESQKMSRDEINNWLTIFGYKANY